MAVLTKDRVTCSYRTVRRDLRPLAANAKVWQGALAVAILSGANRGFYDDAAVGGPNVVVVGFFKEAVDNTGGAAGAKSAEIEFFYDRELFLLANDAGVAVVAADREGACFLLDDQTVTGAPGTNSKAGVVYDVTSEGVWVEAATLEGKGSGSDQAIAGWNKAAADGAAGTATAETSIARIQKPVTAGKAYFVPSAALVPDNANNATILVQKRDGAGGAPVTVATKQTTVANGGMTAFVPYDLGAITNGSFVPGDVLTVSITKAGTGVVVPAGQLVIA